MDAKVKVLVNISADCVSESIDGLLLTRPDLERLHLINGKVVLRRNLIAGRVAVVSGGGAGHEPAHGGLVADGMLAAAVCGDVFASPNTSAVTAALRYLQVHGGAVGAVVIVKNYQGDRLAFGLAVENARSHGFPCELVIVADDVALLPVLSAGKARGLAGTVLVHKVAGALADAGASLAVVVAAARAAAGAAVTLGFSLTTCRVPGQPVNDRLSYAFACEVGLGIHGEPGASRLDHVPTADAMAADVVCRLAASRPDVVLSSGNPTALLINNLGGCSALEVGVFTRSVVQAIDDLGDGSCEIASLLVAPLMSSLDAKGISVTLFADAVIDPAAPRGLETLLKCLQAPTTCPYWPPPLCAGPPARNHNRVIAEDAEEGQGVANATTAASVSYSRGPRLDAARVVAAAATIARACTDEKTRLNALDAAAGDGDTGDTFSRIGEALRLGALAAAAAAGEKGIPIPMLLRQLATSTGELAGGTSGILVAIGLHAAAAEGAALLKAETGETTETARSLLLACLEAGLGAVSRTGGARAGDRTFLDALLPALAAAKSNSGDVVTLLRGMAAEARCGAGETAMMPPRAGRAIYSPDAAMGKEDAGAAAAVVILDALVEGWCSFDR